MNPLNYATLEASKRLVDAGIVIRTDYVWIYAHHIPLKGADSTWKLFDRKSLMSIEVTEQRPSCLIPAPSMAEVWRELPDSVQLFKDPIIKQTVARLFNSSTFAGTNTTDALIELLIWVRREASNDHT